MPLLGSPALLSIRISQTLLFSLLVSQQIFPWKEQSKSQENYSIINRIRIYSVLCNILVSFYYFKNYIVSIKTISQDQRTKYFYEDDKFSYSG